MTLPLVRVPYSEALGAFASFLGHGTDNKDNNKLLFCIDVEALGYIPEGPEHLRSSRDLANMYMKHGARRCAGLSFRLQTEVEVGCFPPKISANGPVLTSPGPVWV